MDQIQPNSDTIVDSYSRDKSIIEDSEQQNFETEFNIVFPKANPIKEEDEVEEINYYEKLYFRKNNITNFFSTFDKSVKVQGVPQVIKKEIFDPIPQEKKNSIISLEEEENEVEEDAQAEDSEESEEDEEVDDSHSFPIDTLKSNNILSDNKELQNNEQMIEKSSSTDDNTRTTSKKPNPFQVYKSTEFNIFHPGGKVELYKTIKNEIQEFDKISQSKPPLVCKFKIKKRKKKVSRKKKKEKVLRKFKPDNIRKKIKSRFFKSIKNRINQILKNANSKEQFDLLPQCFIINITKKKNQPIMKMSFKNLLLYNFIIEDIKEEKHETELLKKKRIVDIKKYEKNLRVMDYLDKNEDVVKKSKFDVIGNMTIAQMFEEYLKSDEFEREVAKLEKEGDDLNYIKDYIVKAFGFVNYFN